LNITDDNTGFSQWLSCILPLLLALSPSSERESESGVKPIQSSPKCRDKGGKMSLKSQTHLPPSSESESELDCAELTKPSQLELRGDE